MTGADATGIRKRSVRIAGHPTSVSLEPAFWDALKDIAQGRGCTVTALIAEVDRSQRGNLSSAVRVFVLEAVRRLPG
ncbi:Ribbon-helix-helix domain-containing protein [uncultured Gammaproteobacteria bacterium]